MRRHTHSHTLTHVSVLETVHLYALILKPGSKVPDACISMGLALALALVSVSAPDDLTSSLYYCVTVSDRCAVASPPSCPLGPDLPVQLGAL